ncbi:MAG: hypothetical protein ONB46_24625 [candidate division KSB1 bacterium]|nr:hypothetical protein [candidate division KSB1 bacterium]MDZ7369040.1 hypothetical protein [candidate division KSB1 bacterium]MDZ7407036.1 hypothetical protein [candidate division KSB1 bacterium]
MTSIIENNAQEIVFEHELQGSSNYERLDTETVLLSKRDKSSKPGLLNIDDELEALFQAYADRDFEDGMESEFIN